MSFVKLCQGDPGSALEYAEKVLKKSQQGSAFKSLAHLYSAEALVMLGRNPEAIQMLDLTSPNLEDFNEVIVTTDNNHDLARSVFIVNVAIAQLTIDVNRAEEILEKTNFHPALANKVLSLRLYLALSKGNVEKGRELALNHFNNSKTVSLTC